MEGDKLKELLSEGGLKKGSVINGVEIGAANGRASQVPAKDKGDLLAWGLLFILALIWGSSFILIKRGLAVYSPGELGALRIISAATFLLPLSIPKLKNLQARNWKLLFTIGLVGSFIPAFLFALAQTQLNSSLTGVLNALTPLCVVIIGALSFGMSFKVKDGIGIAVAFIGIVLLLFVGSENHVGEINYYAVFVLIATICYGLNLNIIKKYLGHLSPVLITSVSLLLVMPMAVVYLIFATDFSEKVATAEGAYLALFYILILGVLGTAVALILFNKLVQLTTPIFTSFVTYLIPIVAVIWGVLDGEILLFGHYAGMVAIILGVYIANSKKGKSN